MKTTLATSTWKPYTIVPDRAPIVSGRYVDDPFRGHCLVKVTPGVYLVLQVGR
jgi:hypothetical protein